MIRDKDGREHYGGSQKWFGRRWQRLSGCASIVASNIAAFYRLGIAPDGKDGESPVYLMKNYNELMKDMFELVKPGWRGFPYVEKFGIRVSGYAIAHGLMLRHEELSGWDNTGEPVNFIKDSLAANEPVALMILHHSVKELDDWTWHWMTLTGYSERTGQIKISNYGREEYLDAGQVFAPGAENEVGLVALRHCGK